MGRIDWSELYVWLGTHGVRRGLTLIGAVTIWDILMFGWRGFFEYSIGWKGILIVWCGLWLILQGHKIEKND